MFDIARGKCSTEVQSKVSHSSQFCALLIPFLSDIVREPNTFLKICFVRTAIRHHVTLFFHTPSGNQTKL